MQTARRKAVRMVRAGAAVLVGAAPLVLAGLCAQPAAAHGSMTDPVSRAATCFAEGPENPESAACEAAVAASGTRAFYDWNYVRITNASGMSRQLIPDGRLCSGGDDNFRGLDLARDDWPSSSMSAGNRTFRYRGTTRHHGSFELYITKEGYVPGKPLRWSDLEAEPFLKVTDPRMEGDDYVFDGIVPNRSGRQLIYAVWQRSDSPEAYFTCSDVVFGGSDDASVAGGGGPDDDAPTAPAPGRPEAGAAPSGVDRSGRGSDEDPYAGDAGALLRQPPVGDDDLAATGGDSDTTFYSVGGAAVLAAGAAVLFCAARRRPVRAGRHSR